MVFKDIKYVNDFPKSVSIEGKVKEFDVIGVRNFLIHDSLMITSTSNKDSLWVVLSLPDFRVQGSLLKYGQGPSELTIFPSVSYNTKVIKESNQLFAYIYEYNKGELLKLNISSSLQTGHTDISVLDNSLPQSLFNFVVINDFTFLCKEVQNNHTQQIRFIKSGQDEKKEFPVLDKLNNLTIRPEEDINILSTISQHSVEHDLVVEMPIGLNYINMYSLDNSTAKTICIGKKLDDIEKIQDIERWDRMYTFSDLRLFPDFFGVMYMNETEKDYQTDRKHFPRVFLFDWQGNPLLELKLNHLASSFDIDLRTKKLYTFDSATELFVEYDISALL